MARTLPYLRKTPAQLDDLSISRATGKKLSFLGYEFEVPWDDVDEGRVRIIGETRVVIGFRSGNALSFWIGPPHHFIDAVAADGKVDRETLRQVYSDAPLQSDYEFQKIMLGTTPGAVTPFISKKQAIGRVTLLVLKGLAAPRTAGSGVFNVSSDEFKGFQYGRAEGAPAGVDVELFSDTSSIGLTFARKPGGPVAITQADINRVLRTLHRLSSGGRPTE